MTRQKENQTARITAAESSGDVMIVADRIPRLTEDRPECRHHRAHDRDVFTQGVLWMIKSLRQVRLGRV